MEILSVSVAKGIYPASESDRDTNPGASLVNYKVVHKGDVVYNSMRMWQGAVGSSDYDGIVSPAYVVARPTIELDSTCFGYLLKRPEMLYKYLCDSQGNSKDTQTLKYDRFADIEATMPANLEEQRAISACLESVDHLITLHQRKYDKLVIFKKSMLEKMFPKDGESVPEIRFAGFTDPWEQRKLGEVAPLQRGFDLPVNQMTPGPYPVVMSNGIGGWHSKYMVKGPGVVTGRSGTIGSLHYIEQNFWPHNTSLWVTSFNGNEPRFIYWLYASIGLERFGSGSGVPTLNRNDVHDLRVGFPCDVAEQRRIGTFFSRLDSLITLHQRKRESRIIRVRSFIWLAGDISGIGVSAYQPEKRRPYDRRQHQRRNVVLRLLRAMDQRIQGRCNS
jgi:type I restriction enzyme S subunit